MVLAMFVTLTKDLPILGPVENGVRTVVVPADTIVYGNSICLSDNIHKTEKSFNPYLRDLAASLYGVIQPLEPLDVQDPGGVARPSNSVL